MINDARIRSAGVRKNVRESRWKSADIQERPPESAIIHEPPRASTAHEFPSFGAPAVALLPPNHLSATAQPSPSYPQHPLIPTLPPLLPSYCQLAAKRLPPVTVDCSPPAEHTANANDRGPANASCCQAIPQLPQAAAQLLPGRRVVKARRPHDSCQITAQLLSNNRQLMTI